MSELLDQRYFDAALPNRVAVARRIMRPLALVVLEAGADAAPVVLGTLRESDTACRLDDGSIALLLEDTPDDGAVQKVERLRELLPGVRAGHACYPADALDAADLLAMAKQRSASVPNA